MQPKFADWLNRKPAGPKPRKRIPQVGARRQRQRGKYSPRAKAYLARHPFCQVTIARLGFREEDVLARAVGLHAGNCQGIFYQGQLIPIATEIHHRNKGRHERLNDERWWMSAARKGHDWVEGDKHAARLTGFLLPFEADQDGRCPDGTVCLETPAFMASRVQNYV